MPAISACAMAASRRRRRACAIVTLFLRCVAVITHCRLARDVTGRDVALDLLAWALAGIAPPASAGGAEGEPVAGHKRNPGRLAQAFAAAVSMRDHGFIDGAGLAA